LDHQKFSISRQLVAQTFSFGPQGSKNECRALRWVRSIIPTAHNSDSPLLRQPIIPTAYSSDSPLIQQGRWTRNSRRNKFKYLKGYYTITAFLHKFLYILIINNRRCKSRDNRV